jgi:hypothetical protein
MKTITGLILLVVAGACTACATQEPPTLPSHPEGQAVAPQIGALEKKPGDNYPGYQRIVVNGQERYCRNDMATGSHTERKAICLTQAQVKAEQLRAQEFMLEVQRTAAAMPQSPMNVGGMAR